MDIQKPLLTKFKEQLEAIFGQSLTSAANLAAEDFWGNWSAIFEGISNDWIMVQPDMLFLSKNIPEYRKFQIWKGLSLIAFLIGVILLFFFWQIGVCLLILGFGFNYYSKHKRVSDGQRFVKNLRKDVTQNPQSVGMAKLCSHYIAGTIQLSKGIIQAHWPQYPSNVLTGIIRFIPTNKTQGTPHKKDEQD